MLETSPLLFKQIIDSLEELIVLHDAGFQVEWLNQAARDYAKQPETGATRAACHKMLFGLDKPCTNCPANLTHLSNQHCRQRMQTPDGSWWEVSSTPVSFAAEGTGHGQASQHWQGIVTRHTLISTDECASEAFYREVVEDQTEFICRFAPDGKLTFANGAVCRHYGIDQHTAAGKKLEDFLSADEMRRFTIRLERITPRHPIQSFRVHSVTPNGCDYWGDWTIRAIYDSNGFLCEYQAVGRDVTAEQLARIELAESEARLAEAQAIARIGSWRWDLATDEVFWSDEVWNIFGLPVQKGPHQRGEFKHLIHPADLEAFQASVQAALHNAEPYNVHYRIICADQSERMLHSVGVVRRNPDGTPMRFSGVVHDITDLHAAQVALEKSESRHRAMLHAIPDLVFRLDQEGRYLEFYAQDEGLLAAPPEQLIGSTIRETLPPTASPLAYAAIQETLRTGRPSAFEYELELPLGKLWFEARVTKCDNAEVLAIVRDITPRKLAAQALHESEGRYRFLFDHLLDPVYIHRNLTVTGHDSYFVEVNRAASEMLGYSREEFESLQPGDFDAGPDSLAVLAELRGLLSTGEPVVFERLHRAKSGELIPVEIHSQIMNYRGEQLFVSVVRDLRPRIVAEREQDLREQRFRRMFEHHTLPMLLIDPCTGQILSANNAAQRFYGYAHPPLEQMNINEINVFPSEDIAKARTSAASEECTKFIFPHKLASGEIRTVEVNSSPIEVEGQLVLFSIISDITERERMLELLTHSERKFRSLLNIAPICIGLVVDQVIQWTNKLMQDMLGYTAEELYGRNSLLLYANETEFKRIGAIKREQILLHGTGSIETRWVRRDGSELDVLLTFAAVDQTDHTQGVIFSALDITESKLAEEERTRLITDLSKSLAEIRTLSGLLPICAHCKKIRNDTGYWQQIEGYIQEHSAAQFSHSICPECVRLLYPGIDEDPTGASG